MMTARDPSGQERGICSLNYKTEGHVSAPDIKISKKIYCSFENIDVAKD